MERYGTGTVRRGRVRGGVMSGIGIGGFRLRFDSIDFMEY